MRQVDPNPINVAILLAFLAYPFIYRRYRQLGVAAFGVAHTTVALVYGLTVYREGGTMLWTRARIPLSMLAFVSITVLWYAVDLGFIAWWAWHRREMLRRAAECLRSAGSPADRVAQAIAAVAQETGGPSKLAVALANGLPYSEAVDKLCASEELGLHEAALRCK